LEGSTLAQVLTRLDAPILLDRAARFQSASPRPFVRWAGSKRSLLRHIVPALPQKCARYYEPFVGSGSLYFLLSPNSAVLNDANRELISTYRAVRDGPRSVLAAYKKYDVLDKQQYYSVRDAIPPKNRFERGARFLYLNRACWNGLYRVNQSGKFNVPYGAPKSSSELDESNLRSCSKLLKGDVTLTQQDFSKAFDDAGDGDLVYLDPPYVTTHNQNGFLDYNKRIFSWNDQVRLAKHARQAVENGAWVIVSNANHHDVRELYRDFNQATLTRRSTLASSNLARSSVSEALFWSGE